MSLYEVTNGKISDNVYTVESMNDVVELKNAIMNTEDGLNELYFSVGKIYIESIAQNNAPDMGDLVEKALKDLELIKAMKDRIAFLESIKKCAKCGNELSDEALFCSVCGTAVVNEGDALPSNMIKCDKCGAVLPVGANFCIGCGAPISVAVPMVEDVFEEHAVEEAAAEEPMVEEAVAADEDKVRCENCGSMLDKDLFFCTECGMQIKYMDDPTRIYNSEEEIIPEPIVAPEPVAAPEPIVEPEPSVELEPALDPEPEFIDEPTLEPEPIVEIASEPEEEFAEAEEDPVCENVVRCANCGTILGEGSVFCTECGTPVSAAKPAVEKVRCRMCGAELEDDMAFCTECGTPVKSLSYTIELSVDLDATAEPIKNEEPNKLYCAKCKAELIEGMAFCTECGTAVAATFDEPTLMATPPRPVAVKKYCKICNNELDASSAFCTNCGCPADAPASSKNKCVNCGAEFDADVVFCTECGTKL